LYLAKFLDASAKPFVPYTQLSHTILSLLLIYKLLIFIYFSL